MANVTVSAGGVRPDIGAVAGTPVDIVRDKILAGAATSGDAVYITASNQAALADADALATAVVAGILVKAGSADVATNDVGAGALGAIQTDGYVTGYTGLTPGLPVYLSTTAGKLTQDLAGDLTTGDIVVQVGKAWDATTIKIEVVVRWAT